MSWPRLLPRIIVLAAIGAPASGDAAGAKWEPRIYYLDSRSGNDNGSGTKNHPWQTLLRLGRVFFHPGDTVQFKRGGRFEGGFEVDQSGTSSAPIVFKAYGNGPPPQFTNPHSAVLNGNAIRANAGHIIIEGLFFERCPANPVSTDVRTLGAVFLTAKADSVIVRKCEMTQTPVGITVYGQHDLITHNYIHDDNEPIKPHWGPMCVVVCGSHEEISYNRFINYCAPSDAYGHDGGAIEINDRSLAKKDVVIHHNLSLRNQGFIEWVGQLPPGESQISAGSPPAARIDGGVGPVIQDHFLIHHNVCMDYQSFLGFTGPCTNTRVENNTVVRVLAHAEPDSEDVIFWEYYGNTNISFRNNIFVWDGSRVEPVFSRGQPYHAYNLFYRTDATNLPRGPNEDADQRRYLGGGAELNIGDKIGNPLFRDMNHDDFHLERGSPAIGAGTDLGYKLDFDNHLIPANKPPDMGAYEFIPAAASNVDGGKNNR
ncbi:MAG: hypothetical protein KGJ60_10975 [Verrucomicrobiota bacterium]|nr:hypothetical protein [Verrucomicrobiota bacterium]